MKTKKIILLMILGIIFTGVFAQKKSIDNSSYTKTYDPYERYSDKFDALASPSVKNLPDGVNAVHLISISSELCYIIRLAWTNTKHIIVYTEGGIDGTKIIRKKILSVSEESVKEIEALIEENDFYNQPDTVNISVRGGETWFLEVNINGKYKAVERVIPSPKTDFLKAIGRKLLRTAGEGISQDEIDAWEKSMENYNDNLKLRVKKK